MTLEEGLETVALRRGRAGERRRGETVSRMKAVVVALGKVGLPLAAQLASAGHEVTGCDIDPRVVRPRQPRRSRRSPARMDLEEALAGGGAAAGGCARRRTRRPPSAEGARPRRGGAAAVRRRRRAARLGGARRASCADDRRRPAARHDGRHRDDACRSAPPARVSRRRSRRRSGLRAEEDFWVVFSPERVFSGRVLRDLRDVPQARRRSERARRGAWRRPVRRVPRRRRLVDGLRRGGRAGEARGDHLPRPQHRLRQRAGPPRRRARPRRRPGDRGVELPAVQPHPPAGRRGRRALHPRLPALLPRRRPCGAAPRRRAGGQRGDARVRGRAARRRARRPHRRRACSSSASPTAAA